MKLAFEPRKKGVTAVDYAYAVLRQNIANLNLEPGCMLNDGEIAEQLGVSRTPVREALNQLKNESQIIEVFPQRGMRIAYIDPGVIRQVRCMRMLMEQEMLRRCCEMRTEEDARWLEDNVELQRFYYGRNDLTEVLNLDNLFHKRFFEIADCRYLYRSLQGSLIHYDRVRTLETFFDSYDLSLRDHAGIAAAVRAKDPEETGRLIALHLDRWLENEIKLRKQYPHYFKKEGT